MTVEHRHQQNRIFAGVDPEVWHAFWQTCTYRWSYQPECRYEAAYRWDEAEYHVPYRLGAGSDEAFRFEHPTHQVMAWCLQSRHCDGYKREEALRRLLACDTPAFAVPFLLRPVSEYVFPIYGLLYEQRNALPAADLCTFRDENPAFLDLSWQRIRSYWDSYHQRTVADFDAMPNVQFMHWLERLEPERGGSQSPSP